jgi:lysophospholipase L1-like esterase
MHQHLVSAGIRLVVAATLLLGSYYVVNHSDFYYLFVGNILLILGTAFLAEAIISVLFVAFKKLRERRTGLISTSRSTFIVIFIADFIVRMTGLMQTYPEEADGRYFSIAQAEMLDSWYWVYTPNSEITNQKKEFLFERKTNSLGLAEQEISKEKDENYRILAIGDSFTEGVGLSYEESWVKQMETRWKDQNVQTINAGIGGSDPVYEFALYRDKLLDYQPDLVVVTINSSDISDIIGRGGFDRFHEDGTAGKPAPSWEWIYAANHVFRMVMHGAFDYNSSLVQGAHNAENKEKAARIINETIRKFKELTEEEGSELLIIIQPTIQDFEDENMTPLFDQDKRILDFLKSEDINHLNAIPHFEKMGNSRSDYYYPIDTHFNREGYAIFGDLVYEKIESLGLLEATSN